METANGKTQNDVELKALNSSSYQDQKEVHPISINLGFVPEHSGQLTSMSDFVPKL